ncbi:transcriptional regulator, PadR family [Oceanobacillus limi]|uniref:Transcriptional regulator, PadR family n=1 Tax=Oceanobacillus limi TaxID=930131 RepID=A0A1I0DSU7_9BACI|nr:PadR family transcriptional regulator [Oceanobacillus limi]SET35668.1 transcriptional regulator, PadR family [Oceanobacillus limi]
MKKINHTKYAILGLLTTGCTTGYAIKQMIDTSLNHFWKISYGQIYPILNELVTDKLATVVEIPQVGKPNKKEYQLTDKGKDALQAWLQDPLQQIPVEKNELLLKLFFARHQDQSHTIQHLDNFYRQLSERLDTYHSIEQLIKEHSKAHPDSQFWLFTLDYGKRITKAAMEWCEDTKKKLNN